MKYKPKAISNQWWVLQCIGWWHQWMVPTEKGSGFIFMEDKGLKPTSPVHTSTLPPSLIENIMRQGLFHPVERIDFCILKRKYIYIGAEFENISTTLKDKLWKGFPIPGIVCFFYKAPDNISINYFLYFRPQAVQEIFNIYTPQYLDCFSKLFTIEYKYELSINYG